MQLRILAWVLSNIKPIAYVLAIVIIYLYGFHNGKITLQKDLDAAVSRERENNLKINTEVSNDLQKKYSDLRKRYDALNRMRASGSVPIPHTPSGNNATPAANRLPGTMGSPLGELLLQADLQTQQLISCQNWIKAQQ